MRSEMGKLVEPINHPRQAVEEVYRRSLVPPNSLDIHFEDSMLSDAHGPNVAINMLVNNQLDCIIGYAFVYALAPVARMSPYWKDKDSNGIPVITSVGLTSNLGKFFLLGVSWIFLSLVCCR
jgi:hypothetical protein